MVSLICRNILALVGLITIIISCLPSHWKEASKENLAAALSFVSLLTFSPKTTFSSEIPLTASEPSESQSVSSITSIGRAIWNFIDVRIMLDLRHNSCNLVDLFFLA